MNQDQNKDEDKKEYIFGDFTEHTIETEFIEVFALKVEYLEEGGGGTGGGGFPSF